MKKRFSKLFLSITSIVMAVITLFLPVSAFFPKNATPHFHTHKPLTTLIPKHFFRTWVLENEQSINRYGNNFKHTYELNLNNSKSFLSDGASKLEQLELNEEVFEYSFLLYQACLINKYMYRDQITNNLGFLECEPIKNVGTIFLISDILTNKILHDTPHKVIDYSMALGLPLEYINNNLIVFLEELDYNTTIHLGEIEVMAALLRTKKVDQSVAILSTDSSEIINYINERPMDAAVDKETAKALSSYIRSIYEKLPINTYEFLTAIEIAKQYRHHFGIVIDKNNLFQILSSTILTACAKKHTLKGYHKAYQKFNKAISSLHLPNMDFDSIMKYFNKIRKSNEIQSKSQSLFIREIIDLSEAIPSLRNQAYFPNKEECDYLVYMGEKAQKVANDTPADSPASSPSPSNSTSSSSYPKNTSSTTPPSPPSTNEASPSPFSPNSTEASSSSSSNNTSPSSSSSAPSKNTSSTTPPSPPSTNKSSPSPSSPNLTNPAPFPPSSPSSCDLSSMPSPNSLDSYNDSPIPKNPPPTPILPIILPTLSNKECKTPAS